MAGAVQTRSTRLLTRLMQQRPLVATSRATRLVVRMLQGKTIIRTSRATRLVLRMMQSVYKAPSLYVETPALPAMLPLPFLHNWQSFVVLETAFSTDVTASAESASEERRSLRTSPGRSQSVAFVAMTRADSARLIAACLRYMHQLNVFPMYSEVMRVTAESSGSVLKCDTRYKRLAVGQLVLVAEWNGRRLVNQQYLTIQQIADVQLAVSAITGTVPVGAKVFPLMQIVPNLEVTPVLLSDDKVTVNISVVEALGATTIPPMADDNELHLNFVPWHGDYPVFTFGFDWTESVQVRLVRPGEKYGQGRDQIVDLSGARPQFGFTFKHSFLNRADFWDYLRFAESRRGRLNPFWVLNPQVLFQVYNVSGNDIEVEPTTEGAEDWTAFLTHIGVLKTDGTYFISAITTVDIDDGTRRITFTLEDAPGFAAADVRRVTSAHLCRYLHDNISERWDTAGVVRVSADLIELLNEVDAPVDGIFPDPIE